MSSQARSQAASREDARRTAGQRDLDKRCIDTIRTLAIDAVEKANSGHAGTPMGLAPVAYTLWQRFLRYDPADPLWPNRDRFVLSAGHASMLLYALLHLAGVRRVEGGRVTDRAAVSLDDIKNFRQLDSVTPGHPEYGHTTGVETTTGPLGQGCGNSVGMAIASRWLAARYNRPNAAIFDFSVYTICSDGDMMEGVASEAASLAGHLQLSNLCWIYDSNTVTIEGHTDLAMSEDVATRFKAYRWNVVRLADANDTEGFARAVEIFRATKDRPTLIIVDSIIGYGAPHKQNTAAAHSDALGAEEVKLAKRFYGWPEDAQFLVPDSVYETFRDGVGRRGRAGRDDLIKTFEAYKSAHAAAAREVETLLQGKLPEQWDRELPTFPDEKDLDPGGRVMHFGVREHAMGAIVNGMTLCKLRSFSATFFNFSDYMRPSMRLGALMEIPAIYIFTHDSIGLGEDGPTHQPVEQLASLRAMPNMMILRPGDASEVVEAYKVILQHKHGPSSLVLTRQAVPTLDRTKYAPASGVARGAYVLADAPGGKPEVILMASGSELSLCVAAYEKLKAEGVQARVVSMPCWELFERQDAAYKANVLPQNVTARVSVEMASTFGWERYVGTRGKMVGMHSFGASAPLKDVLKKFGFSAENVVAAAREVLGK